MTDKIMIIVPAELAKKIDENRGDMSRVDFINYLIDSHLEEGKKEFGKEQVAYATREELLSFQQDIKKLLKNFLDFFVTYGLELGKPSLSQELEELTNKLQGWERGDDSEDRKKATIKWK